MKEWNNLFHQSLTSISNVLFYLLLFFLPTQFGKHFWPEFSFVLGIRVDYLSPTLYFTDIIIFFLFLTSILNLFNKHSLTSNFKSLIKLKLNSNSFIIFLFFICLILSISFSKSPLVGFYAFFKLLEFSFFGLIVKEKITSKKQFKKIVFVLSLGILGESILAVTQFIKQGSVNGLLYFLGERVFNSQTPGIANASLNGELVLRPYATFPHPNVLGGYLVVIMTMILINLRFQLSNIKRAFYVFLLVASSLALFLTMSRIAILLWILIVVCFFLFFVSSFKFRLLIISLLIFGVILFSFSSLSYRFTISSFFDESFLLRKEQVTKSLLMFKDHPLFGVGINNFLVNLPFYPTVGLYSAFQKTQPVHNIFLLVLSETGIFGFLFFLWFVSKTLKNLKFQILNFKKKDKEISLTYVGLFIIFFTILFLGMFDHYFLSLQQGQLLFSLVLGFCWAKISKE